MNVKRNIALIAIAPLLVGLAACSTPPSPQSWAVDRAVEAVDGFLAEPDDAQIAVYKRVLTAEYEAIGMTAVGSNVTWADLMRPALKTCRDFADGVTVTDMRAKMSNDLQEMANEAGLQVEPFETARVVDANLTALRAPGSLCP